MGGGQWLVITLRTIFTTHCLLTTDHYLKSPRSGVMLMGHHAALVSSVARSLQRATLRELPAMIKLQGRKRRKTAPPREVRPPGVLEQFLGWCVHGYTALGLVAAGLIAVLLSDNPDAGAFRWCFLLMAFATIVDSTDGFLARRVRIKEVVPGFDGRRLDDLVDFLTYTFLPLLLIWRAEILPSGQEAWLFLPLLASAYGFCQVQAKTDDGYFLGFPSLWNIVALYLYALPLGAWVKLAIVVVLALLTFVPVRPPSIRRSPDELNRVATLLGIAWERPVQPR